MGTDFIRAPSKASLLALLKSAKKLDARLLSRLFDGVMFKSEYKDSITEDVETVVDDNPVSRHSSLSGLLSDDHTQYARTDGTRAITGQQTFEAGILTDTIGEETAAAGVTVDTLLIKDGNIAAVDYSFVTANDGATDVTAAQLEELTDASTTTLHDHDSTYYTETEIDSQMDAIDYAFVSANDSDTNVTAAQLEELSDGSETLLHSHVHRHDTESFPPICFSSYIDVKARNAVYDLHGGLDSLDTAHDLGAGDLVVTCGTGKIMLAIIAANDFAGDITVTGTTVDRDTGAETGADTDTITIDALTTDNSSTDASGNTVHEFVGAYITSKWFKGSITISSADTDVTDMDTYQVSFEQINDSTDITLKTFDITAAATNNAAWLYAYLYTLHVTGDKCNVDTESTIDLPAAEVTSGNTYRLRRGEINESFSGATDGFWVEMFPGPLASTYWEDINVKVWVDVGTAGTTEGDPIPPPAPGQFWNWEDYADGTASPDNIDYTNALANEEVSIDDDKMIIGGYDVDQLGYSRVFMHTTNASVSEIGFQMDAAVTSGIQRFEMLASQNFLSSTVSWFFHATDARWDIKTRDIDSNVEAGNNARQARISDEVGNLITTANPGDLTTDSAVSWMLLQMEVNFTSGLVKMRGQALSTGEDTGWVEVTDASILPSVEWITFRTRNSGSGGKNVSLAQVWHGSGDDSWPEGKLNGVG